MSILLLFLYDYACFFLFNFQDFINRIVQIFVIHVIFSSYWKKSALIFTIFFAVFPGRDKRPIKSLVVGRPILLALEDIDGGPSFLEKALRFLEKYGKLWSFTTFAFHFTSFHVSDCVREKKNVECIKQGLPYSSVTSPTDCSIFNLQELKLKEYCGSLQMLRK